MKNMWKEIKSIMSLKAREPETLRTTVNNKVEFVTNPKDIANNLNSF